METFLLRPSKTKYQLIVRVFQKKKRMGAILFSFSKVAAKDFTLKMATSPQFKVTTYKISNYNEKYTDN